MASTEQSKAAARMRSRSRGGYDRAKETEGRPNSRMLPAGIKDAVGKVVSATFEENDKGIPVFTIQGITVEPEEYARTRCDLRFWFQDTDFQSYEEVVERFVAHCKMLGLEDAVFSAKDEADLCLMVADILNDTDTDIYFRFDTYRKLSKSGYPIILLQGLSEDAGRPAPKNSSPAQAPFKEGDRVTTTHDFYEDGVDYTGTVISVNLDDADCSIEFDDDGDIQSVPFANLLKIGENEADTDSDAPFEEGDIVECFDYFDDNYTGTVVSVEGDTVVIEFEDGQESVPIEYVRLNN